MIKRSAVRDWISQRFPVSWSVNGTWIIISVGKRHGKVRIQQRPLQNRQKQIYIGSQRVTWRNTHENPPRLHHSAVFVLPTCCREAMAAGLAASFISQFIFMEGRGARWRLEIRFLPCLEEFHLDKCLFAYSFVHLSPQLRSCSGLGSCSHS